MVDKIGLIFKGYFNFQLLQVNNNLLNKLQHNYLPNNGIYNF